MDHHSSYAISTIFSGRDRLTESDGCNYFDMNSIKLRSTAKLFENLQIFGFKTVKFEDGMSLLKNVDVSQLVKDRQRLMQHIVDCISSLRFIHEEYCEILSNDDASMVEISSAKDVVFLEAVSLSMNGVFSCSSRDSRVDLLLNAFPSNNQSWFPIHWAMLSGDNIDEIIYNESPMEFQQYHQQPTPYSSISPLDIINPQESWTAGHFLCASMNDGPNMFPRLKKLIKLNSGAFTASILPDNFTVRAGEDYQYTALHIAARYCGNISMIQEITQLDPLSLTLRYKRRCVPVGISSVVKKSLDPIGLFLQFNLLKSEDWKEIANTFLEANDSLPVVTDAITGCFSYFNEDRMRDINSLVHHEECLSEVYEYILKLLKKHPEVAFIIDSYDQTLLHTLMECPFIPISFTFQLISLLLDYNCDMIKTTHRYSGKLPIHTFVEYFEAKCPGRLAIFDILVGIYPESATKTCVNGSNLIHLAGSNILLTTMLCKRYSQLLRQEDDDGIIPIHDYLFCFDSNYNEIVMRTIIIMCKTDPYICQLPCRYRDGELELSTDDYDESDDDDDDDENDDGHTILLLHYIINSIINNKLLCSASDVEVILRLVLRCYPAAVNTIAHSRTPYSMALHAYDFNPHFLRLLLLADRSVDPYRLHQMNYDARRMALFLVTKAVYKDSLIVNIWKELWHANKELLKLVVSYL